MNISLLEAVWGKNGPPANNAGQPVNEILSHIGILNDKMYAFPEPGMIGPCGVSKVGGKTFSGADRFVLVLYGVAYCDQETGLVWRPPCRRASFTGPGLSTIPMTLTLPRLEHHEYLIEPPYEKA